MNNGKICANCEYNKYDFIDGDFYCTNEHSDNCGVPTFYDDSCVDWEEK